MTPTSDNPDSRLSTESAPPDPTEAEADHAGPRTLTIRRSSVLLGVVLAALTAAVVTLAVLLWSANNRNNTAQSDAAEQARAEQTATTYALGASTINYQDINTWVTKLKSNTTPQLANKFDATAPKLQDILVPLKWTSTATPIAAKTYSESGGIYKINVFLSVTSTNAQTPEGGITTVTYNVTLDKNSGWKITDVSGLDGALPTK